jgi:hypothetical protein
MEDTPVRKSLSIVLCLLAGSGVAHAAENPGVAHADAIPMVAPNEATTSVSTTSVSTTSTEVPTPTAPATTTTTEPPASVPPGREAIAAIIRSVFVETPETAVRVAICESGLNPSIHHLDTDGTYADGLFQIHPSYWSAYIHGSVYDPLVNAQAAHDIWIHNGHTFRGLWECRG